MKTKKVRPETAPVKQSSKIVACKKAICRLLSSTIEESLMEERTKKHWRECGAVYVGELFLVRDWARIAVKRDGVVVLHHKPTGFDWQNHEKEWKHRRFDNTPAPLWNWTSKRMYVDYANETRRFLLHECQLSPMLDLEQVGWIPPYALDKAVQRQWARPMHEIDERKRCMGCRSVGAEIMKRLGSPCPLFARRLNRLNLRPLMFVPTSESRFVPQCNEHIDRLILQRPALSAQERRKLLNLSVNELELGVRAANCLNNANIATVGRLVMKTKAELLKYRNFGRTSLKEIRSTLLSLGLDLGESVKPEELDAQ